MTATTRKSSRRAFFSRGGAALGAGLATGVAGQALAADAPPSGGADLQRQLSQLTDREAVRRLHLTLANHVGNERYEAASLLFAEHATVDLSGVTATGLPGITALLTRRYRDQDVPVLHRAYRQSAVQQHADAVTVDGEGRARATFHLDVERCVPLQADCTAARMARLQGGFAERRWEQGRIDATYVKTGGQWKISSLVYRPV